VSESVIATVGIWSYGAATLGFLAFAVRLVYGWRPGARSALLLAATIATAIWAIVGLAVAYLPNSLLWHVSAGADALRYAIWLLFLGSLLAGNRPAAAGRAFGFQYWAIALVGAALVASVFVSVGWPFASAGDPAPRMAAFGLRLGLAILGLVLVERLLRLADPAARWALKPLCVGIAGLFAFDLFFFADAMLFGRLDAEIWAARGAANALVIPFIALATARNPGWTIEMHVSRGAVFHSTAILVSGMFLLVVAGAGYIVRYLGGEWGRALQIELLFFALLTGVLVVSSGSFRSKLRVFVSKHFFSYRYDYRQEWLRFTRSLEGSASAKEVQEHSVRALADLVESPGGAMWLRHDDGTIRLASRWNLAVADADEPADGSLPRFLERTGWVVDLAEYATEPSAYKDLELPRWLRDAAAAWLVVPLVSGSDFVGFVVLAKSRATIEVNWEVRDLLKVASRQAASYLGQVRATEALVEARKFDAFNRMSAFVVHDLKNLVAQLSLMLKNAERHRDNPEFQRDMLATVQNVVGRMNQLMLQLRTGATPPEKPKLTDLEAIVRSVCAARTGANARFDLDLQQGALVPGHGDRLDHVIGHIVQNALDATSGPAQVKVRLFREGAAVVLEVTDAGVGMSQEFVRERLFKPFETSKPTGMGIGVYESAQYVASLGGQMLYDSTPGVGTRVRVVLPGGEATAQSARIGTPA
jgi:putative PEP-CTERM system histidine kinase